MVSAAVMTDSISGRRRWTAARGPGGSGSAPHRADPEEMCCQYPHLSLAQVHAALAYYYDHQEQMDEALRQELQEHDQTAVRFHDSPIRSKLRAMGKLA